MSVRVPSMLDAHRLKQKVINTDRVYIHLFFTFIRIWKRDFILVMRICGFWSTDFLRLYFDLHFECFLVLYNFIQALVDLKLL